MGPELFVRFNCRDAVKAEAEEDKAGKLPVVEQVVEVTDWL